MGKVEAEIPPADAGAEVNQIERRDDTIKPTAPDSTVESAPPGLEIVDVWSRTQPRYRIRAIALLLLNLCLFCGLCAFNHWLHFAQAFDFSLESYAAPFRFWDAAAPTLTDFILAPISVVDVPLHAAVLGLVLAVMVSVPIVVSILYRFSSSLPFVAAIAIFGHMPWMAITLLGSCILASLWPFRMKFRFASAVFGLLPILLYLYLATRGDGPLLASVPPAQKMLLVAPWLLAIIAAAVILGGVLLIARIVNYRPGAVAPVLAIMFAAPVVLFHVKIGSDELDYRILMSEYGPRSKRFEPVAKSRETQDAIWELIYNAIGGAALEGRLRSDLMGLWSLQPEKLRELKRTVSRRFLAGFLSDRAAASQACADFIADHPHSRYVPNALYIQGRILDMRLDEAKLAREEPRRELYGDFPHVESEDVWLKLLKQYPQSPFTVLAGLRLAKLQLRAGAIEHALPNLQTATSYRGEAPTAGESADSNSAGWRPRASREDSLDFDPAPYQIEAQRLTELIEQNRGGEDDELALAELARLDPCRAGYQRQLRQMTVRFRETALYDNLVVFWAVAQPDVNQQAAALEACTRTFTSGDALPEALYRLAVLETQTLAAEDESRRAAGVARFREIVDRYPDTFWANRAAERLEVLGPRAAEAGATP